jgi:hypothetical protein
MTVVPLIAEPIRLWSVTTIIRVGMGTSDTLVNWAVRTTAEAAVAQREVIAAMVDAGDEQGAVSHLTNVRYRKSKKAMLRGSDLHAAAEAIALGTQPTIPEGGEAYVEQYVRWIERFQPTFLLSEAPVYNPAELYAGTLDGVMVLDGRPLLFDIKTTEHPPGGEKMRPPWPEAALQLCAYKHATQVGVVAEQRYASGKRYYLYDPTARHEPMPDVDGALCIVLSPFDCTAVPVRVDDSVWIAFQAARECAAFQLHTSKGLFGAPLTLREEVPSL